MGAWAVTLALPVSQIGITMLVSVGDLEEAGEHVSFWLQIRRYGWGEHSYPPPFPCLIPRQRPSDALLPEGSSGMPALQTSLFPFFPQRLVSESRSPRGSSHPGLTSVWHAACGVSAS